MPAHHRNGLRLLPVRLSGFWTMQQREAARETTEEGKKQAYRRFNDAVLALSRAFALAAASDEARDIRDEVGFFQTVRAALAKSTPGKDMSSAARDLAVQQIVSRAVVSTEIIDILKAAGMETPDISILSDEFLAEVQGMEKKNLAMEALRKLINGEIRSQSRVNVVQTRAFSDRLEEAVVPLPHQCHHDRGGHPGTDQACQGYPRGAPTRRGGRTQPGGNLILRCPGPERERG